MKKLSGRRAGCLGEEDFFSAFVVKEMRKVTREKDARLSVRQNLYGG